MNVAARNSAFVFQPSSPGKMTRRSGAGAGDATIRQESFVPPPPPPLSFVQPPALRSANLSTQTRESALQERNNNFVLSLCTGAFFFVLGVILGFATAIFNHDTSQLSFGVGCCLFACVLCSLRLPIVYHMFVNEPQKKWQRDRSWSLYLAIVGVGLSAGLMLPAEFMLIEIVLNDSSELAWDRGGWVAIIALIIPLGAGLIACYSEMRVEAEQREKWRRIRRNRLAKLRKEQERDSVALLMSDDDA